MSDLILVRCAQTEWHSQGRLAGDTDLQLDEVGHEQAAACAHALAARNAATIFCGKDQPTRQTATIIAHELRLKTKSMAIDDLREINLGHWEGLTIAQFKDRFGKIYRQWRSDPLSVTPPEGESISKLAGRINACIQKKLKKNGDQDVIVVLGRFAWATAKCTIADGGFEKFWENMEDDEQCITLNTADVRFEPAKANETA